MAIDGASYIEGINVNIPADVDNRSEGAGQIRAIKGVIKRTFPHLEGDYAVDTRPFTPLGAIMMYSGTKASLTPGWEMCDSARTVNGIKIPDLRGRFIMGATGGEGIGATGGVHVYGSKDNTSTHTKVKRTENHTLTIDQIPPHSHQQVRGQQTGDSYWDGTDRGMISGVYSVPTSTVGGGQAHSHALLFDNRPAYYVLSYIIFVGIPEK